MASNLVRAAARFDHPLILGFAVGPSGCVAAPP